MLRSGLWVCFMLNISSKNLQRAPVKGSSVYGTAGWSPALEGIKSYCCFKRKPRGQNIMCWNRLKLLDVGNSSKVRGMIYKQVIKGWIQIAPRRHREQKCSLWICLEGSGDSEEFFPLILHSSSRFIIVCYAIVYEFQELIMLFARLWAHYVFRICCTSTSVVFLEFVFLSFW